MKNDRKVNVSVTLDDFERDLLSEVALQLDRSKSWVVGAAVEHYAKHGGPFDGHENRPILSDEDWEALLKRHGIPTKDPR